MSSNQSDDRDFLDALRSEWAQESEGDGLPPASLDDCDLGTRKSVEWLREAWTIEHRNSPVPVPPSALRRKGARRPRLLPRMAASLVALAAAVLAVTTLITSPPVEPTPNFDTPLAVVAPDPAQAQPPARAERRTEFAHHEFLSREDGIELVSGSVRLVLIAQGD